MKFTACTSIIRDHCGVLVIIIILYAVEFLFFIFSRRWVGATRDDE